MDSMNLRPQKLFSPSTGTVLLLLLVLALPFYPVLLEGKTLTALPGVSGLLPAPPGTIPPPVLDASSAYIDEPLVRLASRQVGRGTLPLWNPHCGLGQPLLGNMQSGLLSPFRWPLLVSPSPWVWDLVLLGRLLVAGILAFLLARALGLPPLPSLGTGWAFALTGYFVLHVNMHHLSVEVLFPGLLWAEVLFLRRPTPGRGLLLGLFTWLVWTGGNPEATLFAALPAGVFLFLPSAVPSSNAPGRRTRAAALLFVLCGTLMAAPAILPGLELLARGYHHHTGATGTDHFRPWTFAAILAPWYYRFGENGLFSLAPPWIGGGVFVLALLGLGGKARREDPFPSRTLAVLAGLLLLKAFGLPGLQAIGRLPLLSMLLFHKYGLPAAALCLALLAGKGLALLAEGKVPLRRILPAGILPALLLLVLHAWNLQASRGIPGLERLGLRPWEGAWILLLPGVLLLLRRQPRLAASSALALAVLELVVAVPADRPQRKDPFLPPPYAEKLLAWKKRGEVHRTVAFQGILCPNTSAALELDDLRINDAVIPARFGLFARACVDGRMQGGILAPGLFPPLGRDRLRISGFFQARSFFRQAASEVGQTWRDRVTREFMLGDPVMDALGVDLLLVREPPGREGMLARMNPKRWKLRANLQGISIYENKLCPGRAFFPALVEGAHRKEEALSWVTRHRKNLLEKAVVEGAPPSWLGHQPASRGDEVKIRFTPAGEILLQVRAGRPRVLLVSEAWYPGRAALVDGKETPCRPADLCMTALQVPPGTHQVRLILRPRAFQAGLLLAALGLLALASALFFRFPRVFPGPPSPSKGRLFKG